MDCLNWKHVRGLQRTWGGLGTSFWCTPSLPPACKEVGVFIASFFFPFLPLHSDIILGSIEQTHCRHTSHSSSGLPPPYDAAVLLLFFTHNSHLLPCPLLNLHYQKLKKHNSLSLCTPTTPVPSIPAASALPPPPRPPPPAAAAAPATASSSHTRRPPPGSAWRNCHAVFHGRSGPGQEQLEAMARTPVNVALDIGVTRERELAWCTYDQRPAFLIA